MIYKEEGHVFQKKAVQDDAVRRTLAFFDKYLQNGAGVPVRK
jgi:hypothetical protein